MLRIALFAFVVAFPAMAFAQYTQFAPPVSYYQSDSDERTFQTAPPVYYYQTAAIDPYRGTYGQPVDQYGETRTNVYNTFDYAPPNRRPNYYPVDNQYRQSDYSYSQQWYPSSSNSYGETRTNTYNTFDYATPQYYDRPYYQNCR